MPASQGEPAEQESELGAGKMPAPQDSGLTAGRMPAPQKLVPQELASQESASQWLVVQQLIRNLQSDGEQAAAGLLRQLGNAGESARDLAYRLYVICERKKWSEEALGYNALVVSWPEISKLAAREPASQEAQKEMFQ